MTFRDKNRKRVQVMFDKPSRTKQCFKDECDINRILDRYKKIGGAALMGLARDPGQYGDCTTLRGYQESLEQVRQAQSSFGSLPEDVRVKCGYSVERFLQMSASRDGLKELGLLQEKPPESGA